VLFAPFCGHIKVQLAQKKGACTPFY